MTDDPGAGAPSRAPFSHALNRTFRCAVSIAEERHHRHVAPGHLLLALTDDADAARVMQACDVDLDRLRQALSSSRPGEAATGDDEPPVADADVQAIVRRAVAHQQSLGSTCEIGTTHLLAAMLTGEPSDPVIALLRDHGMTRLDALRLISHGLRKGAAMPAAEEPAAGDMLAAKILNDDYTPMEFVVHVLEQVFEHDHNMAVSTMMWTRSHGAAGLGSIRRTSPGAKPPK